MDGRIRTSGTVLDWEGRGLAPRGYDTALMVAYSLLAANTAARMRYEFRELLESSSSRAAMLVVCADLLQPASRDDHPHLRAAES